MNQLRVRIESSFDSLENLRAEWDALAIRFGSSIYTSFDWSKTWWRFYHGDRELRIFLFYDGDVLVSVLPLYIDRIGISPFRCSVARLLCASIPPKPFHPPVDPTWAHETFKKAVDHLFWKEGCDALSYGPVSDNHGGISILESLSKAAPGRFAAARVVWHSVHSVFSVPATLDLFMEGVDKDERKKRKYEARLLRRDHSVVEEILSDSSSVTSAFEEFAHLHASQWNERGKGGHFRSWPHGLEFNRALVADLARLGRVRIVRLIADGKTISTQYGFSFGNTFFWELPARITDAKWHRYSLGVAGFFSVVQAAAAEGKIQIEGGLARYEYKQKLNAKEIPVRTLQIVPNRLGSRFSVWIFRVIQCVLEIVYYKLWYQRLAPRLRVFGLSQWSFWLRANF